MKCIFWYAHNIFLNLVINRKKVSYPKYTCNGRECRNYTSILLNITCKTLYIVCTVNTKNDKYSIQYKI
jgi:hypothetical protein